MPLVEWAKDEEKSHDERYGAEGFELIMIDSEGKRKEVGDDY